MFIAKSRAAILTVLTSAGLAAAGVAPAASGLVAQLLYGRALHHPLELHTPGSACVRPSGHRRHQLPLRPRGCHAAGGWRGDRRASGTESDHAVLGRLPELVGPSKRSTGYGGPRVSPFPGGRSGETH